MHVIRNRNVNGMFYDGVNLLSEHGSRQASRGGDVIVMPHPVMSVYDEPRERVLFDATRDANPFFHLMEALWMLAGRDDAGFLNCYVTDFGERFAEQGYFVHGAYGFRWRREFGLDQLDAVVERLRQNPDDRQAVIQMWDARVEHVGGVAVGRNDLRGTWLDRPCNTHVYLRVREHENGLSKVLDLTVLCRSNDIVWGAYGSNAVHFSVLQEYLAGRIGVGVGVMYQFSNNWHGYVGVLDELGDPTMLTTHDPYDCGEVFCQPIGEKWDKWDEDLRLFMIWHDELYACRAGDVLPLMSPAHNHWFHETASLMALANWHRRNGDHEMALVVCHRVGSQDWQRACVDWLERRMVQ